MEIKSDIKLTGENWDKLSKRYLGKVFDTMWGLFVICLSLGIMYDKQMEDVSEEDYEPLNIPRIMFNRYDRLMKYFYQSAVLTSSNIGYCENDRLYLAFSDDYTEMDLNEDERDLLKKDVTKEALNFDKDGKIAFLRKFANYGANLLVETIDVSMIQSLVNIKNLLVDSFNEITPELKKMKIIEDIIEE